MRGFTLVETMIAAGILVLVGLGFTQMMTLQGRQNTELKQQIAASDAQKTLTSTTDRDGLCTGFHPLTTRVDFTTDPLSPATAKKIVSCGSLGKQISFTTSCRHYRSCHEEALSLCQAAFGASSCVRSVFCTQADAGSEDIPVVGYLCGAGLCSNGKRGIFHDLIGSNMDTPYNNAPMPLPSGYSATGSLNCHPGTVPYTP